MRPATISYLPPHILFLPIHFAVIAITFPQREDRVGILEAFVIPVTER